MVQGQQLPIDRGWAWVIVAAASCLFSLQAGGFKCSGILLVELTERYEGIYPTSTLIWVFTFKYILCGMLAPIIGYLTIRFSYRTVTICGVILNAVGYIGLGYAPNFPAMLLLHSVPSGVGDGAIFLCALLVSGQYFHKRKALALGIIASGSGIGTVILPHIYRLLFDNFHFSAACALKAGFCLQFLVPACLYRPLSYYMQQPACTAVEEQITVTEVELSSQNLEKTKFLTATDSEACRKRAVSISCRRAEITNHARAFHSASHLSVDVSSSQHFKSVGDVSGSVLFINESEELSDTVASTETSAEVSSKEKFNWRVILMPKFLILAVSVCFYAFGMSIVYQGLPALGKEEGIPKTTVAIALMVSGAVEIPCRIANGLFADKRIVTNIVQYAFALFLPGLMCILCALISGFAGIILVLTGLATVGTSVFSIIPVVIIELVGTEYVTSGMSVQAVCQSIAFICSSYITGAIYDASQSWRIVYFYVGGMCLLASTIVWPYCLIRWCRQRCSNPEKDGEVKDISG